MRRRHHSGCTLCARDRTGRLPPPLQTRLGPVAAKMLLRALGTTKGAVRTDVAVGALLCADRMMAEDREGALSMLDALSRPDIPDNVRIPAMHLQVTAAASLNRPRTAPSPQ